MSDLIDRQQAIKAVELGITYAKLIDTETGELLEPFKASNDELKRAVQRIKKLPSAQPEPSQVARDIARIVENEQDMRILPKMGHWIIYTVSPFDGEDVKCSECGQRGCAPYWGYCPNCGAKMEVTT